MISKHIKNAFVFEEMFSNSKHFFSSSIFVSLISQLLNATLQHRKSSMIERVTAAEVSYLINQLKAVAISIP